MARTAVLELDTIVAIATPAGRGGLGVVRLSGARARAVAEGMLAGRALVPRHATWAEYRDESGELLDEVVATWFQAPHSATAEDVVEISAHGAPVLLAALVEDACRRGARLAEPGEFTRRAFLHGRMDLSQAEAVGDLITAHTLYQARTAARQMQGSVARLLRPEQERLRELIARLEAGIDFADDDVTVAADEFVGSELEALITALERLEAGFQRGRVVREGVRLALVGRPNVGKSSLFNRLLGRERAIVTGEPGTTRDRVEDRLEWEGVPVELVDTAGIREPESEAERMGIARTWEAAADADVILAVFDVSRPPAREDAELAEHLEAWPQAVRVWNKRDLPRAAGWVREEAYAVSALTGEGMEGLRAGVRQRLLPEQGAEPDFLTVARHAQQIRTASEFLARARTGAGGLPHEILLVDLYEALHALDAITGQTTAEDILGVIFSRFCIGK
ncbi:MAG: tRNA uridine-5-carboxymethylaminomethyl(34) synthesis GTPase MnmE [Terriglobales bacterium]